MKPWQVGCFGFMTLAFWPPFTVINSSVWLFSRVNGWHSRSISSFHLFGLCVSGFCPVGRAAAQLIAVCSLSPFPVPCLKAHFLVRELFQESLPFLLFGFFSLLASQKAAVSVVLWGVQEGIFTAGFLQEQCQAVRWGCKHWCKPELSPENWISSWPDENWISFWHLPQCSQPKQTHSSGAEGILTFIHLLPVCSISALWWSFTPCSALTQNRG